MDPANSDDSFATSTDLRNDLWEALDDPSFSFSGNFYYSSIERDAPNPAMSIKGVGMIGLPLIDTVAGSVVSNCKQISVDPATSRWEIDPTQISFKNPKWESFVTQILSTVVAGGLGIGYTRSETRCKLRKLLVYPPGSSLPLRTRESDDAAESFGKMVILLPSAFEGGTVHVSHGRRQAEIESAEVATFSTSILAWYKDVKYEVKPITSGFRFALSYDLYHPAKPSVPDTTNAIKALRTVLLKWKNDEYEITPYPPVFTFLLSRKNFKPKDREGRDATLLAHFLPVANELGISVHLGEMTTTLVGQADDDGDDYYRRHPGSHIRGYESDDSCSGPTPPMGKDSERAIVVTGLKPLSSGDDRLGLPSIEVDGGSLLPEYAFEDEEDADDQEYTGFCWYEKFGGELTLTWYRSVLFFYRKEDKHKVLVSVKGAKWAFDKIHKDSSILPSANSRALAYAILAMLDGDSSQLDKWDKGPSAHACAFDVVCLAVSWQDLELLNEALPHCYGSMKTIVDAIKRAATVFAIDSMGPGLIAVSDDLGSTRDRVKIITTILDFTGGAKLADELMDNTIAKCSRKSVSSRDALSFVWLAKKGKLRSLQNILIPKIVKGRNSFSFLVSLAAYLHDEQAQIPQSAEASVLGTISQCLLGAVSHCEPKPKPAPAWNPSRIQPHPPIPSIPDTRARNVCELVELALTIDDSELCTKLLTAVCKFWDASSTDVSERFKTIYTPLMPYLRATLVKLGYRVTANMFRPFFKQMISSYLVHVLGGKSAFPIPHVSLGCMGSVSEKCYDCQALEVFLNNTASHSSFQINQQRRTHLERSIEAVEDARKRVVYKTTPTRSTHILEITKRPEFLEVYSWKGRQSAASAFLRSIGEEVELETIMRERWEDVVNALEGTHDIRDP